MAILGRQKVSEEKVAELREQLGLNDPLYVQYGRYLSKALHGDLGVSIRNNQSVSKSIADQMPSTFALAMSALVLALIIGGILGMLAALSHGSWLDTFVMGLSVSGLSIPTFWMGLLLILLFSVQSETVPKHFERLKPLSTLSARSDFGTPRSCRDGPHGARQHVGCAQQGIHHHRPRQRIAETIGHLQTCPAQCH